MANKKQELISKTTICKVNYRTSRSISDDTLAGALNQGVTVQAVNGSKRKYNGEDWEKISLNDNYYYIISKYIK